MTCCLGIQAFLQLGVVMSDVTHQPNHLELGRLEQFKALSTYWDVFCGSGGLWTATVLDSGSPMSHTRHRYPIVPLLLLSIKGSPSRLFEKEKQTTSEVGARVPSLHPATFRMFHTHPVRLAQFAAVWGDPLEWSGGIYWAPPTRPPPTHWKGLSQPSVPDAFPPLLPSLNTRNDPFQHSKERSAGVGDTCFMYSPSVTGQRAILYRTTTPVFWSPYGLFARRPIGFSVRAFVYSSSKRWHLCVSSVPLSGSVGWTCLSAAIFLFRFSQKTRVSLCSAPGHNDPLGTCLLVRRVTTQLQLQIWLNVFWSIINECSSYNQQTTLFKTIHTVKRHPQHL